MIEQDTVKLLRECDAGVKMGMSAIDDVIEYVSDEKFRKSLTDCRTEHDEMKTELQSKLDRYHDTGKDPSHVAQGMSWMKTNVKLVMDESDKTIADLMTDGCNMGVKSINRYLNQYVAADEDSKNMAKRISDLEEQLAVDVRGYL